MRIKDIERSKDALISHYASLVPQGLAELCSEREIDLQDDVLACFGHLDDTLMPIGVVMTHRHL
jgi:hypothetical protein